jgi:CSLREA domain-containing protein
LSTLGWYGGSTQTMIPMPGSPAIGAGMASATDDPNIDQRNFGRPSANGNTVDLGADQTNYLIVVTTADTSDGSPGCNNASGSPCSLRDALTVASTAGSADVAFAPGVIGTINLSTVNTPLPVIGGNLDLVGPGANILTVSGGGSLSVGSIFTVTSSANAAFFGITIANGNGDAFGGGIFNDGTVVVSNVAFSSNSAAAGGGGIDVDSGTVTVSDTTFSGNTASVEGGGIFLNGGTLTVTNSTFFRNSASLGGGIYFNAGAMAVNNSTFSSNSAPSGGGGILVATGTVTVNNSILTGDTGGECSGGGSGCPSPANNGNVVDATPQQPVLAPLGWYGGPTQTMLPVPGSEAICAGSVSLDPVGLSTDQRGFARLNLSNSNCLDAGAVQTNYLIVVSTADTSDTPGCNSTGTGTPCSLRDALTLAASNGSADIAFASTVTGTINLSTGTNTSLPSITGNLDLVGPGANNLTVSGGNSFAVGSIFTALSSNAAISGITIANGSSGGSGGGISNLGTLTVTNSVASGNSAPLGSGIFNGGTLTVNNSTFPHNSNAGTFGGGILNTGTLMVTDSTFSGNTVAQGGGIYNTGALTVNNSTFSGNTAVTQGGGILNYGIFGGTLTLSNSIVAGNTTIYTPGDDCDGCGTQSSSNLINTTSTSPVINPLLAPLGSYGGPTQTMLPLLGSPALCAGSASLDPAGLNTDQRGFPRLNTSYSGYSSSSPCLDLGADQTNYQVQFGQSGYSGTAGYAISTPAAPVVSVTENSQSIGNVPVTLSFIGGTTPTTVSGQGPVTTVAGSGAQFPSLTLRPAGDYTLATSVTITGSATISANVPLDIAPQVPATVTIKGMSTQSTLVDTAFTTPLAVTVADANGMVIPKYSGVIFTATTGANGQSGTFANSTDTVTKNTNGNGVATASTFTANNNPGSYTVSVTAGSAHATFTLTNVADTTLSTGSLSFGAVAFGETSPVQTVTLTNHEHISVSFTSIQISAGYQIASNTCTPGVAATKNCTVGVTFHPTNTGAVAGTLTFTDSAGNSPQVVNLTGTGEVPVAFSTSILRFGSVPVHKTSAAQTVTVTNHQYVRLSFWSIKVSAGFEIASNTCSPAIAPASTCTIGVTFSPTAKGDVTGTLTFTDSAETEPQVVNLTGDGQ